MLVPSIFVRTAYYFTVTRLDVRTDYFSVSKIAFYVLESAVLSQPAVSDG